APDAPILVSPSNGATGVPPSGALKATVSTPTGGPLTVSIGVRKATAPEFTVIALPDTQHYSEAFPAIFTSQTQWIKDNKAARNIVFVTHEGDIVQNYSVNAEWVRANESMSILDGVLPYGMAPGNHDEPSTLYNQFFPYTRYQGLPWYGGHYQTLNDNNYQLFSAGGMDFVWVHLDFCPTAGAVAWGSSILGAFPNRIGMVTTHAYLGLSAERSTHVCGSTQYLWDGLVPANPNLHFMLSGHVHGESRRSDVANGHPVFQMLADYQDRSSGGQGWLRILRFVPNEDRVYVQTYSPWLNQYESDADSEFTLDFPMGGAFVNAGAVVVNSGATASVVPAGLLPNTEYEWQVTVTNGNGKSRTGPVWRFTTGTDAPPNQPPVANGDSYSVQSGNTLTTPAPGVLANDTDPESSPLAAEVVVTSSHGSLNLAANGSFLYTPAAGYVGPDSFTYRVSDSQAWSNTATVALTVTAAPPVTVFTANFNATSDSFTYQDNTFRGTTQQNYAAGARISSGGFTGGALRVEVGGVDKKAITNMSGGWRRTFTLAAPAAVTLSFRYNMDQGIDYESDDISQVLASVNGVLKSAGAGDWVAQLNGNGNGGAAITTGWQLVTIELGVMPAGTHTLILGGFNNKKDTKSELTTVLIDDVTVVRR
ncbi:MAG TPA: Ig-like domain-containing protein, partial [Vicinamibacterales bacterium]|nr:Ig-like domain-containing protein [Vicinamibacterales bacterium]